MGLAAKVPNWDSIRLVTLNRDGWRCVDCGRAGRLEVHHIQGLKDGGSNEQENLKSLCIDCHKAAHGKQLERRVKEWADMVRELR